MKSISQGLLVLALFVAGTQAIPVNYHSAFRLVHVASNKVLMALNEALITPDSDSFLVALTPSHNDKGSLMQVLPPAGVYKHRHDPILCGDTVQLRPIVAQNRYVAPNISVKSPLSPNQIVATVSTDSYGEPTKENLWTIVCRSTPAGKPLTTDDAMSLKHSSGLWLGGNGERRYKQPGLDHFNEVYASEKRTAGTMWQPGLGVYYKDVE